jgi:hypothetical protein
MMLSVDPKIATRVKGLAYKHRRTIQGTTECLLTLSLGLIASGLATMPQESCALLVADQPVTPASEGPRRDQE